jgi:hypothetical protein
MKTKIIKVTVIFLLISVNVSAQLDHYQTTLNGKVEQIIEKSGETFPNVDVLSYNRDGFLVKKEHYKSKDIHKDSLDYSKSYKYKFDSKNRVNLITTDNYDIEIKYRLKHYIMGSGWSAEKYTYNHKVYKIHQQIELGLADEYYKWNKDKTLLLELSFIVNKKECKKYQQEYGGSEITWSNYKYIYKYNEKELLISEEYKTKVDTIYDLVFISDSLDNISTQYVFNHTESRSYVITFQYDINDNLITELTSHFDGTKKIITYDYEYDSQNNWTKKQRFRGGNLTDTDVRIITYFQEKKLFWRRKK